MATSPAKEAVLTIAPPPGAAHVGDDGLAV